MKETCKLEERKKLVVRLKRLELNDIEEILEKLRQAQVCSCIAKLSLTVDHSLPVFSFAIILMHFRFCLLAVKLIWGYFNVHAIKRFCKLCS